VPAPDKLSAAAARRLALAAAGLTRPRPARVTAQHVHGTVDRMQVLQLDSVNVLARSHYLVLFSRLGAYDAALLDEVAYRRGRLFEAWAHEASLLPLRLYPLNRWNYEYLAQRRGHRAQELEKERPGYIEAVYAEVAARGPVSAGELSDSGGRSDPWWGLAPGKQALEWLFDIGRLAATRRSSFERVYDLTERVIPAEVLAQPVPERADAQRELLRLSVVALGIATADDALDYFRLHKPTCRPLLADLVDAGDLVAVEVEGWGRSAYADPGAVVPRRVDARALLSPFDPVVWCRPRAERIWGFHYRIGIYTPAPQRTHGYYVLPFLLGDDLVARVDVKADRKAGTLLVPEAHLEPHAAADAVTPALAESLREMADWLGLDRVSVGSRGDLSSALRRITT
jgi:uncharacterized protein YcaQ